MTFNIHTSSHTTTMATQRADYKKRIVYIHSDELGQYHYGIEHPMKPFRLNLTYSLVLQYGLHRHMQMFEPQKASYADLAQFHSHDYIDTLKNAHKLPPYSSLGGQRLAFVVNDCPAFPGLYDYACLSAGASLTGARMLANKTQDIVVNWSGGLHHARKSVASGFCYVNDIVLAIQELLKSFQRVLYIDIDVHHGDGVQEAFYLTDRVMTVSLHRFGDGFFPGTGHMFQQGVGPGKYFSVNVPLREGIDDESYDELFVPIMQSVREHFRPSVVVLQCGADSLAGDRLGRFSLSVRGHGKCVEAIKKWNLPLLVLGGGGYTAKNVARCWTYETALLCDQELDNNIPENFESIAYFGPDYTLHPKLIGPPNLNTKKYLSTVKAHICEGLRAIDPAPSVQMKNLPDDMTLWDDLSFLGGSATVGAPTAAQEATNGSAAP